MGGERSVANIVLPFDLIRFPLGGGGRGGSVCLMAPAPAISTPGRIHPEGSIEAASSHNSP